MTFLMDSNVPSPAVEHRSPPGITAWASTPTLVAADEERKRHKGESDLESSGVSRTTSVDSTGSASSQESLASTIKGDEDEPFHIFSRRKKLVIVYLVSLGSMFSPFAANIYFPAVQTIAYDLNVSTSLVALTITVYMVVQGLAPSIWGPWSDICGRRIIFTALLLIYIGANVALAFTPSYPFLLAFRGVQAAGSAAIFCIGTGVVTDIALPSERGSFIGTISSIRMVGQAVAPVIGGIFAAEWGFRSIFWLLLALAVLALLLILAFVPETQRAVAGNGSVRLAGFHRPWMYLFFVREPAAWRQSSTNNNHNNNSSSTHAQPPTKEHMSLAQLLRPLRWLTEKDVASLLTWGALVYAGWTTATSSTATVLAAAFPRLTQLQLGLCFLPNGAGCVLGSVLTGRLMDRSFARTEARYRAAHGIPGDVPLRGDVGFPFERARLVMVPWLSGVFVLAVAGYGAAFVPAAGWGRMVASGVGTNEDGQTLPMALLAAPLAAQFFIGYTATAIFNINSAMMADCFPDEGAAASAVNNLARCTLSAAGVAVVEPLIGALGPVWAFVLLAGVAAVFSPLVWVEWRFGQGWRVERERRLEGGKEEGMRKGEEMEKEERKEVEEEDSEREDEEKGERLKW